MSVAGCFDTGSICAGVNPGFVCSVTHPMLRREARSSAEEIPERVDVLNDVRPEESCIYSVGADHVRFLSHNRCCEAPPAVLNKIESPAKAEKFSTTGGFTPKSGVL